MKKRIALLLVLCLTAAMIPMAAAEETVLSGSYDGRFRWTLDEHGALVFHDERPGEDETANWEDYKDRIRTARVESGVDSTCICFRDCVNMTSVELRNDPVSIGSEMFYNCRSLTSIEIPESVQNIGQYAFFGCTGLTYLRFPDMDSIDYWAFANCYNLSTIVFGHINYIGYNVFGDYNDYSGSQLFQFPHRDRHVFLSGSEIDLRNILHSEGNEYLTGARIHENVTIGSNGELSCDCGVRYPIEGAPSVTAQSFSLSFEDEILVNLYFTAENTMGLELGMLVFNEEPTTVDINAANGVFAPVYDAANQCYMAQTDGIAAKEMGDIRYYCAYARKADGTCIYSGLYAYSPRQYAMSRLANSADENLKALCVAMLNYGTAAQVFFGYRTDDLMNAELTQAQQALVTAYDPGFFTGAVAADPDKTEYLIQTETGFSKRSASVSFEGALGINYYFTPEAAPDGGMTLYYWNTEDYKAMRRLNEYNYTGCVEMTPTAGGAYWGQLSGIPAKALDDTYYVTGIYYDAEGNKYCTGVIAYTLSKYCMNNAYGTMGALSQATAMYGYYADNYFAD